MCGINGRTGNYPEIISRMNTSINHRGPDDSGVFCDEQASLGHLRLSIVDLSPAGHQPMGYSKTSGASSDTHLRETFHTSDKVIVFNGEIYNHLEIRKELETLGYVFSTHSDTEVILAAYCAWGEDCLHKFNGMWAFVIYDKTKNILFCSRDRFGVKPFYYAHTGNEFIFSSELKGVLQGFITKNVSQKDLSADALELYFSLGFIPAPYTIYNNISKLEAGHNVIFDIKTGLCETKQYYTLPQFTPEKNIDTLVTKGKELLKSASELRMRSDVPVGAFLSGGLDSSSVVATMTTLTDQTKLHTFSIGFEGLYDETSYIEEVKDKFKTIHHHQYFKEQNFKDLIDEFVEMYDEPYGSPSGFPTYEVSKLARSQVTVSLSGDGGDEVFAGYNSHYIGRKVDLLRKVPKPLLLLLTKLPIRKIQTAGRVALDDPALFRYYAQMRHGYTPELFKSWTKEKLQKSWELSGESVAEASRIFDALYFTLPDDFLMKVDRASMRHALEVRSPFMDYRFMEFAQTIPTKHKVSLLGNKQKLLLKKIAQGNVPQRIIDRTKQGFTPPIETWITGPEYQQTISEGLELLRTLLPDAHQHYQKNYIGKTDKYSRVYLIRLFLFTRWYQRWCPTTA